MEYLHFLSAGLWSENTAISHTVPSRSW